MSSQDSRNSRLNTLKLDQRGLEALDARFSEELPNTRSRADREHTRFEFRKTLILLELVHPDGNIVRLPVVSRNLSRQGIALMHSAYVHVGTECRVCIACPPNKWIRVPGNVSRCEHRSGTTHELGIRFDEEIDARDILRLDSMSGLWTRERVDPQRLRGRLLVLDTDDLTHRLIDGLLKDTELQVLHATTAEEALQTAPECDLVLCEYHLDNDTTGAAFTTNLLQNCSSTPVLLMTGDRSERVINEMRDAGASGLVAKPLSKPVLRRALAEFLFEDETSSLNAPNLPEGDPRAGLVTPFLSSLPDVALKIEQAMDSEDHAACFAACRELAGQAPSLGFDELGRLADEAMTRLQATPNLKEAARELSHLVGACRTCKAAPPPPPPSEPEDGAGDGEEAVASHAAEAPSQHAEDGGEGEGGEPREKAA